MWDRWRDLTRFRFACEMALASYRTYVNGFPVTSTAPLVMTDPAGSAFKCDLADFTAILNDDQQLYRVLFPSYVALVEDLGANWSKPRTRKRARNAPPSPVWMPLHRSSRRPNNGSQARPSRHGVQSF
ncbi:hypothetical protein [Sphingobium chungangianum]